MIHERRHDALAGSDARGDATTLRARLREWPRLLAEAVQQLAVASARVEVMRRGERIARVTLQAVARATADGADRSGQGGVLRPASADLEEATLAAEEHAKRAAYALASIHATTESAIRMDARAPKDRLTESAVAALVTQTPAVERYVNEALRTEMEFKRARLLRDLARADRDPRGSTPETVSALLELGRKAEACLADLETALNKRAAARAKVAALRAEGIGLRLEVTLFTRHPEGGR